MIEYKYADLFTQDTVDKQVLIEYDGGVITNTELFSESMELTETLCSESELRFGACEASVIKFKVGNMLTSLIGKWITVKMYLNGNATEPLQIGKYKVYSDKPTADRKWRDIVAYDAMYEVINTDVADWYNEVLPNEDSTMTMKAFRTSFLSHFGITQENVELVNDNMVVAKTIQPDEISGKDVITAICEINGCFGHITRNGTFKYIYLDRAIQGLYPRNDLYPANDLYPRNPKLTNMGANGGYINANYDDFTTQTIDKLQIRKEENDIGVIIGGDTPQNPYIIEDNFLVYGKSTEELRTIANNIFNKITMIIYRPYNATVRGNPCFEVGDAVRLVTRYELIESYVLQRTLKGIQALRDSFSAKGVEKYGKQVNSMHKSILELKGKSNVLERTIEETKSTIVDVEKGLESQITQTANSIKSEVSKTYSTKEEATQKANTAESNAKNDTTEKLKSYSTTVQMNSAINQKADSITSTVNKQITETKEYADGKIETLDTNLSTKIMQNAEQIVLKVDANGKIAQVKLSGSAEDGTEFVVKADNINMSAAEVINFMAGGDLNLTGKNIKISSNNFSVNKNGDVECRNITAWGISGNAVNQFNKSVDDSEALGLARQAISNAASAAAKAQEAANVANTTVNNLVNTVIPDINSAIQKVADRVSALEAKHSS